MRHHPNSNESAGGGISEEVIDRGLREPELAHAVGRDRGGIRNVLLMLTVLGVGGAAAVAEAKGKGDSFEKDFRALNEQLAIDPSLHSKHELRATAKDRCVLEVVSTEEGSKGGEYTGVWATYVSAKIPFAKIDPGKLKTDWEEKYNRGSVVFNCTGSEECIDEWTAPASIYDGSSSPEEHDTSFRTSLYFHSQGVLENVRVSLVRLVKLCGGKFTPGLMAAVERNDFSAVEKELKKKGSLNEKNRDGETPLMIAAKQDNAEIVKLLLRHGADVHQKSQYNSTALYFAVISNHHKIVEMLIAAGADVNERTGTSSETSLMHASDSDNLEMIKLLLRHGADINVKDETGSTALIGFVLTFGEPHPEVVQYLIDSGADINLQDNNGQTALDLAKVMHQVAIDKGNHARAYKFTQIIAALQAAGARPSFQSERNATVERLRSLLTDDATLPENLAQSIALAKALVDKYPNQAEAHGVMALVYWGALQGDLAIQHYNRACELAAKECEKRDKFLHQVEGSLHRCLTEQGEAAKAACARAKSSPTTLNQLVVGKYLTNSGRLQKWIGRIVSVRGRVFSIVMTYVRDNAPEYRKGKTYDIFFDKAKPLEGTSIDATIQGWK